MNGRRVFHFRGPRDLLSGEYGQWHDTWYVSTPNGHLADLSGHDVTEHADGTITVSPSIAVSSSRPNERGEMERFQVYHGYLERGIWRPA